MERRFSSSALYRTLGLFFRYPEEPLNPRLVSYRTGVDIKAVIRELRKLREMGILRDRERGRYRLYKLNREHPAFQGLRSIFHGQEEGTGPGAPDPVDLIPERLLRSSPP